MMIQTLYCNLPYESQNLNCHFHGTTANGPGCAVAGDTFTTLNLYYNWKCGEFTGLEKNARGLESL